MQINIVLNGKKIQEEIEPDLLLIDFVRKHGCKSVKRGCETSGCGLCTVFLDDKPVLSCSILAARVDGHKVTTLEGLKEEAEEFGAFIADQGAEQCGFCNPGMIMNALALFRENEFQEICAVVPGMKDSFAESRISLPGRKKREGRKHNANCKSASQKKRCHAACDRSASLHG